MRKHWTYPLVILAALASGPVALAERSVSETRAVAADGTVRVELLAGSLRFVGWDRSEIEVSGTIGDDVEEVEIDRSGKQTTIEVLLRRGVSNVRRGDAHLVIRLPRQSTIEAETVSADVEVEGARAAVRVESVSGTVVVDGPARELELSSVSGTLTVRSPDPVAAGAFETVSGAMRFDAPLDPRGRFSFESVSGGIELRLPAATSAEFDVATFSGEIDNDFGPPAERSNPYLPAKSLRFSLGAGGARVRIEAFSGRVELRRR